MSSTQEIEHLQKILAVVSICIFFCWFIVVRNVVAKALSFLHIVKRSHVSIWNRIQKHNPHRISARRTKTSGFTVVRTAIKGSSELIWPRVGLQSIEPKKETGKFSLAPLYPSISIRRETRLLPGEVPVRSGQRTW